MQCLFVCSYLFFVFVLPRLIHLYNCQKSKRTRICLRQLCRALKELKSRVAQSLTHFTELLTRSLIELSWTVKKDCWRIEEILRYGKNILFSSSWYRSYRFFWSWRNWYAWMKFSGIEVICSHCQKKEKLWLQ